MGSRRRRRPERQPVAHDVWNLYFFGVGCLIAHSAHARLKWPHDSSLPFFLLRRKKGPKMFDNSMRGRERKNGRVWVVLSFKRECRRVTLWRRLDARIVRRLKFQRSASFFSRSSTSFSVHLFPNRRTSGLCASYRLTVGSFDNSQRVL